MSSKITRFLLPVLLPIIMVSLVIWLMPSPGGVKDNNVPESRKIAISTVIEVNKFIISLAFIIMGFFGSILIGKIPSKKNALDNIFFLVSCTCSLIAVYLGYKLYDALISHLNYSVADMKNHYIQWVRDVQFIFILASVICFLIFIYTHNLKSPHNNEEAIEKLVD